MRLRAKGKNGRVARKENYTLGWFTCKKGIVGLLHVKNDFGKEVRGWKYVQNCKRSKIARKLDKKCFGKSVCRTEITCKKDKIAKLHVNRIMLELGLRAK